MTFRTFYKQISLACRGGYPPAGEGQIVECSECDIFLFNCCLFSLNKFLEFDDCHVFHIFVVDVAETEMWADTSANFFPVAAFSNVFLRL